MQPGHRPWIVPRLNLGELAKKESRPSSGVAVLRALVAMGGARDAARSG